MENPPYYAPFSFIKPLTSSLCKMINHKVEFHVQVLIINNNVHAYVYACVVSQLVVKNQPNLV